MSNEVLIALIVAVAVVVVIFMVRQRLRRFGIKSGVFEAEVETHPRDAAASPAGPAGGGVRITKNTMKGRGNRIDVRRGGTEVEENRLRGEDQEIVVGPDEPHH